MEVRDDPDNQATSTRAKTTDDRRPPDVRTVTKLRMADPLRTSDAPTTELNLQTSEHDRTITSLRTSDAFRTSGT